MTALFARELGVRTHSDETFFLKGALDVEALRRRVESMRSPALLLATSFALVHLLDALAGGRMPLPPRSRVMQTGGFKGKSREVDATQLRREVARAFDVPEANVVAEYGMTELSSQAYEACIAAPGARHGVYVTPPWMRVVPVDPVSLAPVADGAVGIARIEDLMNVDSAVVVLASDRVRRGSNEEGFELLGREPGAAPRGCSIAVDEMFCEGSLQLGRSVVERKAGA
jgi:hypothetical protein